MEEACHLELLEWEVAAVVGSSLVTSSNWM